MGRNIVRCKNGHSYNAFEYQRCPHCGEPGGEAWTQADETPRKGRVMEDSTVAYTNYYENESGSIPNGGIQYKKPVREQGYSEDETRPETYDIKWKTGGSTKTETEGSELKRLVEQLKGDDSKEDNGQNEDETHPYVDGGSEVKNNPVVGWLVCVSGDDSGISYPLRTGRNFIGRSVKMDVALMKDRSVSRDRHAIIVYDPVDNKFYAGPGEAHGLSYLNGKLVTGFSEIAAYDRLKVGATELIFVPFCGPNFTWN